MSNTEFEKRFNAFALRMNAEHLPKIAINTFRHHYRQLYEGHTGMIPESDIQPVDNVPDSEQLKDTYNEKGKTALDQTVMIKLNGGLGTGMGLHKAKSLITVREGLSFLDIIVRQALNLHLPLILMNSFVTREDSLAVLNQYPELKINHLPQDFLQHKVPKIRQDDLTPVVWSQSEKLEWCPPGHGDIYTALVSSGLLDTLLISGKRYAFISNADNLGAVIDTAILGYFASENLPFLMEVADRTEQDKKGGHLAQTLNGQFILRETAQCSDTDIHTFQDISRHRFFNTNNLWIDLPRLKETVEKSDYVMDLSLIRNSKTVDPTNPDTPKICQLETAMGSAISIFNDSRAMRVPRRRFVPVKTTSDLLLLQSDLYCLDENFNITKVDPDPVLPSVELDQDYYKSADDFELRFTKGVPELANCKGLKVSGDVRFNSGNTITGNIQIINNSNTQKQTEVNQVIDHDIVWNE